MAPKSFFWYPTGFQEYLYIHNLWPQQQQQEQLREEQQSSFIYGITSSKMLFQWAAYVTKVSEKIH